MNPNEDDLQSLFDATAPVPRPVDIDQLISVSQSNRSRKPIMRLPAIALAVAAAVVIALGVFPLLSTSRNLAFAEVLEQLESITSVAYIQASYIVQGPDDQNLGESLSVPKATTSNDGEVSQGKRSLAKAIDALGEQDNRTVAGLTGSTSYLRGVLQSIADQPESEHIEDLRWVRIKAKHLQRTDSILPIGGVHDIIDAQANLQVSFDHSRKVRHVLGQQVVIDRENNTRTENAVTFSPRLDFFRRLRSVPSDAVKLKESREIDGQQATGFQTTEEHRGTWLRTYWIGNDTKLPLEIVTEYDSSDSRILSCKWVQSHFVYNNEMPDSWFSTSTPEGYKSEESKVYGYR